MLFPKYWRDSGKFGNASTGGIRDHGASALAPSTGVVHKDTLHPFKRKGFRQEVVAWVLYFTMNPASRDL